MITVDWEDFPIELYSIKCKCGFEVRGATGEEVIKRWYDEQKHNNQRLKPHPCCGETVLSSRGMNNEEQNTNTELIKKINNLENKHKNK